MRKSTEFAIAYLEQINYLCWKDWRELHSACLLLRTSCCLKYCEWVSHWRRHLSSRSRCRSICCSRLRPAQRVERVGRAIGSQLKDTPHRGTLKLERPFTACCFSYCCTEHRLHWKLQPEQQTTLKRMNVFFIWRNCLISLCKLWVTRQLKLSWLIS